MTPSFYNSQKLRAARLNAIPNELPSVANKLGCGVGKSIVSMPYPLNYRAQQPTTTIEYEAPNLRQI